MEGDYLRGYEKHSEETPRSTRRRHQRCLRQEIAGSGSIIRVDITKEEIRGEGATVTANIAFKDGSTKNNDKTNLIKEKGSWKIALGT